MPTTFQLISIISIIAVTFAGGFFPLFKQKDLQGKKEFPNGEAFSAGVFLALSLTLMLPSAFHLFGKTFPKLDFPIASFIAVLSFIFLLLIEHWTEHLKFRSVNNSSFYIPVIMTIMIAIPSFFLGTALGISNTASAVMIFVAILAHKSSAAFALSLKMVRSKMTRTQIILLFSLFAISTPFGIITGEYIHKFMGRESMMIIKAVVLSVAAGTFLYMGTIHEFKNAPLIKNCNCKKGYLLMLAGFILTAFVRFLIGEAHKLQ